MGCTRLTLKKYTKRPSPPYHAGDCAGETMKGNDGKLYKSVADKRGVYTWKLAGKNANITRKKVRGKWVKPKTHEYEIHDNGDRPFIVMQWPEKREFVVNEYVYSNTTKEYSRSNYIMSKRYKNFWVGDDIKGFAKTPSGKKLPQAKGNTILVELSGSKFIFIGHKIYEFKLKKGDEPVSYISYLGNNDVPYPYLIGKTHTYLLLEEKIIPNSALNLKKDAYAQMYASPDMDKQAEPLAIRLIEDRRSK